MKLTVFEKLMIRSPLRVRLLRFSEAPKVLAETPFLEGADCLELGGGYGHGALLIKHYTGCRTLISIDIDDAMVEIAKKTLASPPSWASNIESNGIIVQQGNACNLPFPDNTFDAVFHFFLLDHINNWRRVMTEVYRVLKPGGVYSFEDALLPDSPFFLNEIFGHIPIKEEEIRESLAENGFHIRRMTVRNDGLPRCYVSAWKRNGANDDDSD